MSGHSKWATIRRKKSAVDAKRGKIFTKVIREIQVAAKIGGGDESANPRLRNAIQAAKEANMPAINIERAIKKGTGELEGVNYEEVSYEAYGPGGVALFIEALTDNKNRTVSEIRHLLTRHGGNLASSGSVAWMFSRKGIIVIERDACSEDDLLGVVIDAGANDIKVTQDEYEIDMEPAVFEAVRMALDKKSIPVLDARIQMVPQNVIAVDAQQAPKILNLMEILEDHDDVQNVAANFDIDDQIIAKLQENA
jgi:YebC/PmpR family DNA-binding regulatory protein